MSARAPQKVRTRRVKPEITVNLVRTRDNDTYEVKTDYDMVILHATHKVTHEKGLIDPTTKMFGNFYIVEPK